MKILSLIKKSPKQTLTRKTRRGKNLLLKKLSKVFKSKKRKTTKRKSRVASKKEKGAPQMLNLQIDLTKVTPKEIATKLREFANYFDAQPETKVEIQDAALTLPEIPAKKEVKKETKKVEAKKEVKKAESSQVVTDDLDDVFEEETIEEDEGASFIEDIAMEDEDGEEVLSLEKDLMPAFSAYAKKNGPEKTKAVLAKFKAKSIHTLNPNDYEAVLKILRGKK